MYNSGYYANDGNIEIGFLSFAKKIPRPEQQEDLKEDLYSAFKGNLSSRLQHVRQKKLELIREKYSNESLDGYQNQDSNTQEDSNLTEQSQNILKTLFPQKVKDEIIAELCTAVEKLAEGNDVAIDKNVYSIIEKVNTAIEYTIEDNINLKKINEIDLQKYVNELISKIIGIESKYFIPLQVFAVGQIYRYIGGHKLEDLLRKEYMALELNKEENPIEYEKKSKDFEAMKKFNKEVDKGKEIIDGVEKFKQEKERRRKEREELHSVSSKFVQCLVKGITPKQQKEVPQFNNDDFKELNDLVRKTLSNENTELGKTLADLINGKTTTEDIRKKEIHRGEQLIAKIEAFRENRKVNEEQTKTMLSVILGEDIQSETISEKKTISQDAEFGDILIGVLNGNVNSKELENRQIERGEEIIKKVEAFKDNKNDNDNQIKKMLETFIGKNESCNEKIEVLNGLPQENAESVDMFGKSLIDVIKGNVKNKNVTEDKLKKYAKKLITNIVGEENSYLVPFTISQFYRYIGGQQLEEFLKNTKETETKQQFNENDYNDLNNIVQTSLVDEKEELENTLTDVVNGDVTDEDLQKKDIERGKRLIEKLENFKKKKKINEDQTKSMLKAILGEEFKSKNNTETKNISQDADFGEILVGVMNGKITAKDLKNRQIERGEEIIKKVEEFQQIRKDDNNNTKKMLEGFIEDDESKSSVDELKEHIDEYTNIENLIKSVSDTPRENIISPNTLGKSLIDALNGGLNQKFEEAVKNKTKAIDDGILEQENLTPNQWLERIDSGLMDIVKKIVPENNEFFDLVFNFAKFFTYKFVDKDLRQYLERELFRLRACEYEVPFYLDDFVSDTQEPIQDSDCWWVPILGYGGDQRYGCFGYGEAGPNPHPIDESIIGTML